MANKKFHPVVFALFLAGLLFSNISFGNGGIAAGTTLVLEPGQYPAAIKKHNAAAVYILYWGTGFDGFEMLRKNSVSWSYLYPLHGIKNQDL